MSNVELTENEKNYIAGFFDGEGSIWITYAYSFTAAINLTQLNPLILYEIQALMKKVGIKSRLSLPPNVSAQLFFNKTEGTKFLELILPYMKCPKKRRRALIYMKMFPVELKGVQRHEERIAIYEEWLDLRILELKEKL